MSISSSNIVQSLYRGLVGLEMAADGEVSPQELADKLDIDRSSAYRLLYTLMDCGYLIQGPQTRKFTANGIKFLSLSGKILAKLDWVKFAGNYLKTLCSCTGETTNLGILEREHVIYVGQEQPETVVRFFNSLGTERPLHSSALGKAILGFLDEAEAHALLNKVELCALTPKTITNQEMLKIQLGIIRKQGYAIDDEECYEGVRCIAAPVFDSMGNVIASMGVSGPTSRLTLDRLSFYTENVAKITKELSRNLGCVRE